MYNTALMSSQQMEDVGFKVDLQVVDWATLVQRRGKPELFDIFSTGFTLNPDPAIATAINDRTIGAVLLFNDAIALTVVFIMVAKPSLTLSFAALLIAPAVGAWSAFSRG